MAVTHHNSPHISTSRKPAGHTGVPRENVIDLRAVRRAEMQHIDLPQPALRERLAQRFQDWRTRRQSRRQHRHAERAMREHVIVSRAHEQPSTPIVFSGTSKTAPSSAVSAHDRADLPAPSTRIRRGLALVPGWPRRLAWFAAMCLVLLIPVVGTSVYRQVVEAKGVVLGISSDAYGDLRQAGSAAGNADFAEAADQFRAAAEAFTVAQGELDSAGGILTTVAGAIPGKVQSAESLLDAGKYLSQAGATVSQLIHSLAGVSADPADTEHSSLTTYLAIARDSMEPVAADVDAAVTALQAVRLKDLPDEYQRPISTLQQSLPIVRDRLTDFSQLSDALLYILGDDAPRRYVLAFQNNRELRPTGGFIGSVALVDISRGSIENIEVPGGGVYDIAGQLQEKLIAPKPLWLVNPHWNIQDSNWFPDFPASAKKMMWFFERTGGTSVDGVLTLTPTVIERMLDITGPIDLQADYGITVTADNFVREAQTFAEITYDRDENQPKKFIGDLVPIILNRVFHADTETLTSVVDVLIGSLQDHNMLLYFSDAPVQSRIAEYGWDGGVRQASDDYLYVVNTNIAGGKTDHVIDQFIRHDTAISADGSVIDTVSLTRVHRGSPVDAFDGQANVSYVRFYVPQGSTLISAEGFDRIPASRFHQPDLDAQADTDLQLVERNATLHEQSDTRITQEFGKTAFGNWISIDPGESQTVTIRYRLPQQIHVGGFINTTDTYSLYVQSQPGTHSSAFIHTVALPEKMKLRWASADAQFADRTISFSVDLDTDRQFSILLDK